MRVFFAIFGTLNLFVLDNSEAGESAGKLKTILLKNRRGTELEVLNFGAAVSAIRIPAGDEKINVVVGPKDPMTYLSSTYHKRGKYFGSSVGRFAGRISNGGFTLDGKEYTLPNKNNIHLHGGKFGFSYKFWKVHEQTEGPDPSVILSYLSPDGEEGYPGDLQVSVRYTLTDDNEVKIRYSATTNKETLVNLTNHTYFNLDGSGDVNAHQLKIDSAEMLETNEKQIPTGEFLQLKGTAKDFSEEKEIGKLPLDTTFVLEKKTEGTEDIILKGPKNGISLQVFSNQPGVVVYIPETLPDDWDYNTPIASNRAAICLENQNFPDAPNRPEFPSARLEPGEEYLNEITWKFSVNED
jgi:aldose 1-epimerase